MANPTVFFDVQFAIENEGLITIVVESCFFMKRDGTYITDVNELMNLYAWKRRAFVRYDVLIVRCSQQIDCVIPDPANFSNYPKFYDPNNPNINAEGIAENVVYRISRSNVVPNGDFYCEIAQPAAAGNQTGFAIGRANAAAVNVPWPGSFQQTTGLAPIVIPPPAAASADDDFELARQMIGGPNGPQPSDDEIARMSAASNRGPLNFNPRSPDGSPPASARMWAAAEENARLSAASNRRPLNFNPRSPDGSPPASARLSANSLTGPGRASLIGPWSWTNEKERGKQLKPKHRFTPKTTPNRTLDELGSIILVDDIISQETKTITEFFEDNKDYNPFVLVDKVRENPETYSGNAIDWDIGNKEFIECLDDAPVKWQGNAYQRYIKPPEAGGRRFIKVFLNGASIFILKPDWYDSQVIPGNRFFKVIKASPVFKYMNLIMANGKVDGDYNAMGANHCNQKSSQDTYSLVEVSLSELNDMVPRAGGTKRGRYSKRRKQSKKKYSKRRKQSKKGYSKRRKS